MGPHLSRPQSLGPQSLGSRKGHTPSVMPHPSEPESIGPPPSLRGLNHRRLSRRGPNRMMMMYRGLSQWCRTRSLGLSRFGLSRRALSCWGLSRCIRAPVVRASAVGAPVSSRSACSFYSVGFVGFCLFFMQHSLGRKCNQCRLQVRLWTTSTPRF